jgi:hypothetical protein
LAEIIAFIKHIKDEPLALLVVVSLALLKITEAAIKYAPDFFSKNKKLPANKWQEFVSSEIGGIKANIEKLTSTIMTHEYLINKTSEGTLENQLFSDERNAFLRLKAFRRLLAMGKNGRVWEKGFQLLLKNKETWRDVLDTELGIEIVNREYFNARLNEINIKIFDGFM